MENLQPESVNLVYVDPPFFSQKRHRLSSRDNRTFEFSDIWADADEYKQFISARLRLCRKLLRNDGSLFLHCDRAAAHHLRLVLDDVFGAENFQSEIIWSYKRWSNNKKGLLNAHQTIYFYSKTDDFKFNTIYTEYSPTTNVDQILQKRERDARGKSSYMRSDDGKVEIGGAKRGVPLTDVWEIPYLNPKASERTGYPTQKPLHLLERIIKIASDPGDLVLDPFCGSGTTVVAAGLLGRDCIGIDASQDAVSLTESRLAKPVRSESRLMTEGKDSYLNQSPEISRVLELIDATPVQRNSGIDGFLKRAHDGLPIPVRIQRDWETFEQASTTFAKACSEKGCGKRLLIVTNNTQSLGLWTQESDRDLVVIHALHLSINDAFGKAS
jgi:site-specific DNA-methyltransferase (adenine-specific)